MPIDLVIGVNAVSKIFPIFAKPRDRLKQFILPRLQSAIGLTPARYYREFHAVRSVSMEVRRGEAWGIIGRNGSGKSTLLQMIAGTLSPTTGSIETSGRVAALLELGSGFNPEFTGRENVYLNGSILGLDPRAIDARMTEILNFADIGEFIDRPLKTYSSGMAVRLAFAVAVCIEPEVLIVDEALAVGDAGFQFKCLGRIRQMRERGMTLLLVSHDLGMVKTFCDHALYLRAGAVVLSGPPEKVGEAYLQDLRAEQRRSSGAPGDPVLGKSALPGAAAAFGTRQGHIISAVFMPTGTHREMVETGSAVTLRVEFECDATVTRPRLTLALMDRRHVVVAGKNAPVSIQEEGYEDAGPMRRWQTTFSFAAHLGDGTYFVTLVLEDGRDGGEVEWLLVDKQAAALTLEVHHSGRPGFIGLFDIGIAAESRRLD